MCNPRKRTVITNYISPNVFLLYLVVPFTPTPPPGCEDVTANPNVTAETQFVCAPCPPGTETDGNSCYRKLVGVCFIDIIISLNEN